MRHWLLQSINLILGATIIITVAAHLLIFFTHVRVYLGAASVKHWPCTADQM